MASWNGKIGIGVLGGGGDAAEGHIRGYQEDPRAEVVALWDVDEAKGRAQGERFGVPVFCQTLDELLAREDVDAVSICTPDHLHGYHFRPDYQAMVEAYQSGEIGQAWLAEGDYISNLHYLYGETGRTTWRSDPSAPQDILLGGGCHPLALMRWALGAEVTQVFAYSNHKAEPLLPIDDCYVTALRFSD